GAVGPEIEKYDGVVVANQAARRGGFSRRGFGGNHDGKSEFVGDAFFVTRANGGDGIGEFCVGVAVNHRAIGFFDALPAVVAVHRVVTADDGGDLADGEFAHFLLELTEEVDAAVRRRVAAVQEAVHENARDLIFARHAKESEELIDVRVDAADAKQAEQMKLVIATALHGFDEQGLAREFAVGDKLIDARAVHMDDAARADVKMAHFAVAHLTFGQTDVRAGSVYQRVGEILEQAIVVGLARKMDTVALACGTIAPSVEDSENHRFWAIGGRRHFGRNNLARWVRYLRGE